MDSVSIDKRHEVSDRILAIVNHLIQTKSIFQNFNPLETSQDQTEGMLEFWSLEQIMEIPEDELISIIKDIMIFDAMSGLIADFTPEEMASFEAAVAGR